MKGDALAFEPVTEYRLGSGGGIQPVERVRVDGTAFRLPDGRLWQWRGATDFLLYQKFLAGEDIDAVIHDRVSAGANLVRVLGMVDSFSHFYPQEHGDYYDRLRPFADYLAARGLYLEFVVFADATIIMPNAGARDYHALQVAMVLAEHPAVFFEVANEPGHTDQISADEAYSIGRQMQAWACPVASGRYDLSPGPTTAPRLDYVTTHCERKPDWPRTGRALAELRDGFGWSDGSSFAGFNCAIVGDEPTGADEQPRGDSRSSTPEDFMWHAATCALMGAGATFHSESGIFSRVWGPVQRQCAEAFFAGLRFAPPEAQFAPYQRGAAGGGSGVGGMPIQHHDLDESAEPRALRRFCKLVDGKEYCVSIRTTVEHEEPIDGWRIVAEPSKGLTILER